ncbi:LysR family transcriptional regulator [Streptomyces sp. NPDC102451]|uniref:LysR family transcriptional regulator n=1 Tax=Streptomyces sp. NPDC102451 TaxID=3366177 RepID=UPI00382E7B6E
MVVDLVARRLRQFIVVAEELNFTRAGARLFVAQQALSRQIRQLEEELGVQLFERTTRRVALTQAGEALLADARLLVAQADETVDRVRRTAAGKSAVLRLGFVPGGVCPATRRVLAAFEAEHPHVEVRLEETSWNDPDAGLGEEACHAAVLYLPHGQNTLDTVPVDVVSALVALPRGHVLAEREALVAEDLKGLPSVWYDVPTTSFLQRWNVGETAVRTRTVHEWMAAVATGRGFGVTGSGARAFLAVPGITYRPVTGLADLTIGFAARRDEANPYVRALLECARAR